MFRTQIDCLYLPSTRSTSYDFTRSTQLPSPVLLYVVICASFPIGPKCQRCLVGILHPFLPFYQRKKNGVGTKIRQCRGVQKHQGYTARGKEAACHVYDEAELASLLASFFSLAGFAALALAS